VLRQILAQEDSRVPVGEPIAVIAPAYEEHEISMMRRTIARRMVQGKTTAPHFYVTVAIDGALGAD
jgi:pyruvate/2-oxoglutarate dehydrogenase complex dihydrolipoamide acyltransferase (E2) component